MKVLVTGLCFHANKGGAALALSFIDGFRKYIDEQADFVFSVPVNNILEERKWAERYGVEVCEESSIKVIRKRFNDIRSEVRGIRRWFANVDSCDLVIEYTAISYVGPPSRPTIQSIWGGRFANFVLAKLKGKRIIAWTQSVGPFGSFPVSLVAWFDFLSQPYIFCRGEKAKENVERLPFVGRKAKVFPDTACILDFDKSMGRELIELIPGFQIDKPIATLSFSTVPYRRNLKVSKKLAEDYLYACVEMVMNIRDKGFQVILVPHSISGSSIENCDLLLSKRVKEMASEANALICGEDLGARELKSIISNSELHVSGRYHSVIAGISTGVPTLALSWHEKYRDIMEFYKVEHYVHNMEDSSDSEDALRLINELFEKRSDVSKRLEIEHQNVKGKIRENFSLLRGTL